MSLNKDADELLSYAELLNDEFGEYCVDLCTLGEHCDFISQNEYLYKALEGEISDNLGYFKNNYKIVKRMQTIEQRVIELEETT